MNARAAGAPGLLLPLPSAKRSPVDSRTFRALRRAPCLEILSHEGTIADRAPRH